MKYPRADAEAPGFAANEAELKDSIDALGQAVNIIPPCAVISTAPYGINIFSQHHLGGDGQELWGVQPGGHLEL